MILREGPMKKLPFSHLQTVDTTDEMKNVKNTEDNQESILFENGSKPYQDDILLE